MNYLIAGKNGLPMRDFMLAHSMRLIKAFKTNVTAKLRERLQLCVAVDSKGRWKFVLFTFPPRLGVVLEFMFLAGLFIAKGFIAKRAIKDVVRCNVLLLYFNLYWTTSNTRMQ